MSTPLTNPQDQSSSGYCYQYDRHGRYRAICGHAICGNTVWYRFIYSGLDLWCCYCVGRCHDLEWAGSKIPAGRRQYNFTALLSGEGREADEFLFVWQTSIHSAAGGGFGNYRVCTIPYVYRTAGMVAAKAVSGGSGIWSSCCCTGRLKLSGRYRWSWEALWCLQYSGSSSSGLVAQQTTGEVVALPVMNPFLLMLSGRRCMHR